MNIMIEQSKLIKAMQDAGLVPCVVTMNESEHFVVDCEPTEWRQAYTDRLKRAGWNVIRFGQTIEYAGHVGRIAQTEIEISGGGKP